VRRGSLLLDHHVMVVMAHMVVMVTEVVVVVMVMHDDRLGESRHSGEANAKGRGGQQRLNHC
jgi:hypothetical protein